jgi:hypothetical protein
MLLFFSSDFPSDRIALTSSITASIYFVHSGMVLSRIGVIFRDRLIPPSFFYKNFFDSKRMVLSVF